MDLIEIIYGIIFYPSKTLRTVSENKPIFAGIVTFLIVMLFNVIINQGISGLNSMEQVLDISSKFAWAIDVIIVFITLIALFLMAGLYSLLAEVIYKKAGNGSGLLAGLSFASIPGIFGPPLQYITILMGFAPLGYLISFVVTIWLIVLQVISIREALNLTTSQAILLFIIPIISSIIIIGVIVTTIISQFPLYY